jgi:hypothetical protein
MTFVIEGTFRIKIYITDLDGIWLMKKGFYYIRVQEVEKRSLKITFSVFRS